MICADKIGVQWLKEAISTLKPSKGVVLTVLESKDISKPILVPGKNVSKYRRIRTIVHIRFKLNVNVNESTRSSAEPLRRQTIKEQGYVTFFRESLMGGAE